MSPKKEILTISSFIILTGFIFTFLFIIFPHFFLEKNVLINVLIQLWIFITALISATIVIASYIHTNNVFVLSQKPHLLIKVISDSYKETCINYINTSPNPFYDLTICIFIYIDRKKINLSDLFHKKMYMASQDNRIRRFNFINELKERGIKVDNFQMKKKIKLTIFYSYTFNNRKELVQVQEYKYNLQNSVWEII